MLKEKLKIWLRAARPFTLTASAIPVILGGVLGIKEGGVFHVLYFTLAVIAMIFLQISANLINDCDDYLNNVDTQNSDVSCDVVIKNLLEPSHVFKAGVVVLFAGTLIGSFLSYKRGVLILILAVIGAMGSYFYTRRPFQLKYKALGIPLVFLLFGPLPVIGAYYIQVQEFSIMALYVSIPVGLLTTAILHANDIRDIYNDNKAGIKTLSIVLGIDAAKKLYYYFLFVAYFSTLLMSFYRVIPLWSLIVLITVPAAWKNIIKLYETDALAANIKALDRDTAKLQAQFGCLLIIALVTSII